MLVVENLVKRYGGFTALRNVSFTVSRGVHGLVGPNGAGKTTTLKSIVGLVRPDSGRIIFRGEDLLGPHGWRLRRLIGYVAEIPVLPDYYRVLDLLEELAALEGLGGSEARRAARGALELVGLEGKALSRLGSLSKGEKKRLYIAQALLQPRELYVFDEPFTGLDPEAVSMVRSLLRKLSREAAVLVSSHILRELEELASSVTIIYRGSVLYTGSVEELAARLGGSLALEAHVDDVERAARILSQQGFKVEALEGRVVVYIGSRSEASKVTEALVRSGVQVYEARVRGLGLEEAYIKLIRGAEGGAAPG